jgi:hypothetical protein
MRNDEGRQVVFNSSFTLPHSSFLRRWAVAIKKRTRPPTYGLMAEFDTPTEVVAAARRVH